MNREKQIDEISKLICTYPQCVNYNKIGGCKIAECRTVDIAENLFEKGYRKASEVAEEIIADVATLIEANWKNIQHGTYWLTNGYCIPLRELLKTIEKKYTEDEK